MIPLCDLKLQYQCLCQEIDAAMRQVAADAHYILGPNVARFEKEAAAELCCEYAVGVGSGTDALHLALKALDIGPGDEVITTPFTFVATTEAIGMAGAAPAFVDIDPGTLNIDPQGISAAVTPRTKAVLPVHLYGQPCRMAEIMDVARRHGLAVIEDCAQAIGATYQGQPVGTFGDVGCFSFFPSSNLGTFGDGGLVVTDDRDTFERVEMLRRHGGRVKDHHSETGLNSRLDELQAAILRIKLPHLDCWNGSRRRAAYRYNARLSGNGRIRRPLELATGEPITPESTWADQGEAGQPANGLLRAVYDQYTVLVPQRDDILVRLREAGIGCAVYYPVPLHLQQVHADLNHRKGDFPEAEYVARHCLSLPMFPELTEGQIAEVCRVLLDAIQCEFDRPVRRSA